MIIQVCEEYRKMTEQTKRVNEAEQVQMDKYSVEYTYEIVDPQTNERETKTGTVSITVPVGVMIKLGTPKKV